MVLYMPKNTRVIAFYLFAQETFGLWRPEGLELLKEIGTTTVIASGKMRARATLFQNISMIEPSQNR